MELIKMYGELGISEKVLNYGREIEKSLHDRFEAIDKTAEYNQLKVLHAMQKNKVSERLPLFFYRLRLQRLRS